MTKSPVPTLRLRSVVVFAGALAATATLSLFGPSWSRSVLAALEDSPKAVVDEAWQIVNRDYVDPTFNKVDWQATRQKLLSKNYSSREEAYAAIRGALERLEDPYTRFMDPKQYEALTNQTAGELTGVGLRLELKEETKFLTVVEPIENSPALKAGIQPGDKVLAIDGKSTKNMNVEAAAKLIRGEVGTKVKLKLSRQQKGEFELTLTRAQIELPTVRSQMKQEGSMRIGYIRLNEFSSHASSQMRQAIKNLNNQKVDAFVLDLRGNPGGLLHASIDIAQMWLEKGSIVRTVDRKGESEEFTANRTALTKLPLAVLVDGNSASASEILSGALKDNGRAKIIGSQTFGKALVQSVHALSDGSGLAVTIAHYYTPKGTDISQKGVTPDIKVDLSEEDQIRLATTPGLMATKSDPQYAKAIASLGNTHFAKPIVPQSTSSR